MHVIPVKRRTTLLRAIGYILAQLSGAMLGTALVLEVGGHGPGLPFLIMSFAVVVALKSHASLGDEAIRSQECSCKQ